MNTYYLTYLKNIALSSLCCHGMFSVLITCSNSRVIVLDKLLTKSRKLSNNFSFWNTLCDNDDGKLKQSKMRNKRKGDTGGRGRHWSEMAIRVCSAVKTTFFTPLVVYQTSTMLHFWRPQFSKIHDFNQIWHFFFEFRHSKIPFFRTI